VIRFASASEFDGAQMSSARPWMSSIGGAFPSTCSIGW
jgi:hypothetical protein